MKRLRPALQPGDNRIVTVEQRKQVTGELGIGKRHVATKEEIVVVGRGQKARM